MRTITFYSYKGGVGRSLLLANIATRLSEFGKKVCLLDFDLEAPGLHYKFSNHLAKDNIELKNGIVDYIYGYTNEGRLNSKIIDYSYGFYNYNLAGEATSKTFLIPAGNSADYWKKLSSINWDNLLFENTSGIAFLLNLKEKIKNEISPEFLLIDSRTGISEKSAITLSLLADEVVIVAANNKENLEGTKKIIKSISDPEYNILSRVPKITFVLSRIPFTDAPDEKAKEQNLTSKIAREFGPLISEINVIHSDRELELDEQIRIGDEKEGIAPQVTRDYLNLFEKLTINDFAPEQKIIFQNINESHRLYQRAISESKNQKKLEFIDKAIELNRNKEFYLFRASINDELENIEAVIKDCNQAIDLDTMNIKAYELKGRALLKKEDFENSGRAFELILGFDKNHTGAKLGLAEIYITKKEYDRALITYDEILNLHEENLVALTGRANLKLLTKNYISALNDIYKALSYDVDHVEAIAALVEINARLNNLNEFYLNLRRALKLDAKWMENFLINREIQKFFKDDKQFKEIIERYNLHLNDI